MKTFCAAVLMLCAVRFGIDYPILTTVALLVIAGVGVALFNRRPASLPPTRHERQYRIVNLVD